MNIRSLRYFVRVAECGSLTRAAAELHVSQPALTRHISLLEDEFNVKLLMRYGRGVLPTEAGGLLLERATSLIAQVEDLSDQLTARETEPRGQLAVGLPYAWSQLAIEILSRFREQYPAMSLRMIIESSEELKGMLKARYIDAAVLTMLEDDPEIASRVLAGDNQFLVGPTGSGLADLKTVPLTELACRPMIRQHNSTVGLKRIAEKLSRKGLTMNTVIQTSSSLLLDLVEAGLGYVAMAGCALPLPGRHVEAARIEGLPLTWTFGHLTTRPTTAAINAYEQILREVMSAKVASGEWPMARLLDA